MGRKSEGTKKALSFALSFLMATSTFSPASLAYVREALAPDEVGEEAYPIGENEGLGKQGGVETTAEGEEASEDQSAADGSSALEAMADPDYVAEDNKGMQYESFEQAVADAESGGTITLLANVTLTQLLVVDKQLTIVGDGRQIVASDEFAGNTLIEVAAGSLTIDNVTVAGGEVSDTYKGDVYLKGASSLTVNNGSIGTLLIARGGEGGDEYTETLTNVTTGSYTAGEIQLAFADEYWTVGVAGNVTENPSALWIEIDDTPATDEQFDNITWSSSDESVLKVLKNGALSFGEAGKATVTATYCGATATREVEVQKAVLKWTDSAGESTTCYSEVPSALQSSGVYQLLDDVQLSNAIVPQASASNVTLDLNGHKLTSSAASQAILLDKNGTDEVHRSFSVVNTSEGAQGSIQASGTAIHSDAQYNDIVIGQGVAITSETIALCQLGASTTTLTGATVTGSTAIYAKAGTVEIDGGTIAGAGAKTDYAYSENGANATGDAIVVESCGHPDGAPNLQIKGATVTSTNAAPVGYYVYEDNTPSVALSDTKFDSLGTNGSYKWVDNDDETTNATYPYAVAQAWDVKFISEGTEYSSQVVKDGDYATKPADPSKNEYVFDGWYRDGVKWDFVKDKVTEETSLTANWTPISSMVYSISYDLAGGSLPAGANPLTYTVNSAEIELQNPTRIGYDFAGWIGTGLDKPTQSVTINTGSTGNRSYTATWTKQTMTIETSGELVYDGTEKHPTITVKVGDTELESTQYVVTYKDAINAGTNVATVTVTGKGDYAGFEAEATYSIAKATQKLTFATAQPEVLTYAPGATFTNVATAKYNNPVATIEYASKDETVATVDKTTGVVTVKKSGEAIITATAKETPNANASDAATYTLIIEKAAPTLAFASGSISVKTTGTVHNKLTTNPEGLAIEYSSDDETVATVDKDGNVTLTKKEAPEGITITAKFAGDDCYTAAEASYTLIVDNDTIGYTVSDFTGIYNGADHTDDGATSRKHSIIVSVDSPSVEQGSSVTYATSEEGEYSSENPSFITAGTHTVYYKIQASGYDTVTGSANVVINRRPVKVTAEAKSKVYGEKDDPELTATVEKAGDESVKDDEGLVGDDTINYSLSREEGENAGTYKISVSLGENPNYDVTTVDGTFTIQKAALSRIADIDDAVYNGEEHKPTLMVYDENEQLVEDTAEIDNYSITYTANTNAGTATVTVSANANTNYVGTVTKSFIIQQRPATITATDMNKVYGESDPELEAIVAGDVDGDTLNYSLSREEGEDAGAYKISVTLGENPNYRVSATGATFTIKKQKVPVPQAVSGLIYNGAEQTGVKDDGTGRYTLEDQTTATNAGTYSATATLASKNYEWADKSYDGKVEWTIAPASISKGLVQVDPEYRLPYNGKEQAPDFTVYDEGNNVLVENIDYTVSCVNNKDVGIATAMFKGQGNYKDTLRCQFEIAAPQGALTAELSDASEDFVYSGKAYTPEVTVKHDRDTLTAGKDYTVSYQNNKNAGTADYVVKFKDNFAGKADITGHFRISPATITDVNGVSDKTYNGNARECVITVKASDLAVSASGYDATYSNNTNAGTATLVVKGKGNFKGTLTKTFRINPAPITSVSAGDKTYNGKPHTPKPTVKAGSLTVPASSYTVTYSRNTNAGTARITVKGTGNFSGTKDGAFVIKPAQITSITAIKSQAYTGSAVTPKLTVKAGKLTVPVAGYTATYSQNTGVGTAKVSVTGKANGNYAGTVSATFSIVAPTVSYHVHCQTHGWMSWVRNGAMAGTSGESKRLEAIQVKVGKGFPVSGGIEYRTHVQTYGWEKTWSSNGEMSGTSGEAKRLEAIQIRLTGDMKKKYDVYYRVHAQTFGWMGWASNGASAGTAAQSKRLEAIQIVLVPKGGRAPSATYAGITGRGSAFRQG